MTISRKRIRSEMKVEKTAILVCSAFTTIQESPFQIARTVAPPESRITIKVKR
jgi:hypothetical protein